MGIILSILSAIIWAIFDVVRKKSIIYFSEVSVIAIIIISQFFFFLITLVFSELMIDIERYIYYSIFLIFLNLISIYFFLKVLKSGELSTYVPMLSFTPLFSALYSYIILGSIYNSKNNFFNYNLSWITYSRLQF